MSAQRFNTPDETFSKKVLWPTVLISWHLKLKKEVVSGLPGHHSLENLVLSGVRRVVGDDCLEILLVFF